MTTGLMARSRLIFQSVLRHGFCPAGVLDSVLEVPAERRVEFAVRTPLNFFSSRDFQAQRLRMSALGQKRTSDCRLLMSALPPKSGHCETLLGCLLCANSGSSASQKTRGYWMTSSAVASNDAGTVRPSALAVFRLMTISNFVGPCTGRSVGFSPLRILST